MILMVLLVVLTSSVCGMNTTFCQAEEDDDITIRWDIHTNTDMSLTNMLCFLLSNPEKVLYQMVNSVEVPESQDQQFAGRVQCDRDALRDGRIRLLLSRLRPEDSGNYWCDLAANYNKTTRRWVLMTTDSELTPGGPKKEMNGVTTGSVILIVAIIILAGAVTCLTAFICRRIKDQHQARCAII